MSLRQKKTQKTKKAPEQTEKSKAEIVKGENKLLKKRLSSLEKRIHILEVKLEKLKDLDVDKFSNYKKKKTETPADRLKKKLREEFGRKEE